MSIPKTFWTNVGSGWQLDCKNKIFFVWGYLLFFLIKKFSYEKKNLNEFLGIVIIMIMIIFFVKVQI